MCVQYVVIVVSDVNIYIYIYTYIYVVTQRDGLRKVNRQFYGSALGGVQITSRLSLTINTTIYYVLLEDKNVKHCIASKFTIKT